MRTSQGVALVVYNMPNRNHCSRQRMQNSIRQHIYVWFYRIKEDSTF